MDLVGSIRPPSFSLALHHSRAGAALMERSRRIAVTSVPFDQAPAAFALAKNHRQPCVVWNALPFPTSLSGAFQLPLPAFALPVREMHITGGHPVVVLSFAFWQHAFGGDRFIAEKQILLNNRRMTVLGVTPRNFTAPKWELIPTSGCP